MIFLRMIRVNLIEIDVELSISTKKNINTRSNSSNAYIVHEAFRNGRPFLGVLNAPFNMVPGRSIEDDL